MDSDPGPSGQMSVFAMKLSTSVFTSAGLQSYTTTSIGI